MPELVPAAPGSPEWLAARRVRVGPAYRPVARRELKLSRFAWAGMVHGAYQAAMRASARPGYHPAYAFSWQYRRGFARAFLLAREARHG